MKTYAAPPDANPVRDLSTDAKAARIYEQLHRLVYHAEREHAERERLAEWIDLGGEEGDA